MSVKMYGIRNCDTIKKARAWLTANRVEYDFHDYKSDKISESLLRDWVKELGWERLLNRSGTTFRKLPDPDKADLDQERAVALMIASPSLIRRPILDVGERRLVGFDPEEYRRAVAR